MARELVYEKSIELKQSGYTLSVRVRPATIRGMALRLLPWAVYAAMPQGRGARVALLAAQWFSPMVARKPLRQRATEAATPGCLKTPWPS